MSSDLTVDALIQLVHRYYPVGLTNGDPRYIESEQEQRIIPIVSADVGGTPQWKDFIRRIVQEFSDCLIWDTTTPYHDPCFSCQVSLPGFVMGNPRYDCVVFLLSRLAPVYAIYASHVDRSKLPERDYWVRFPPLPAEYQSHEARIAGLIESTFGFTRLSNDVLFTPIPDLVPRTGHLSLGEAKLIDCLFTPYRP